MARSADPLTYATVVGWVHFLVSRVRSGFTVSFGEDFVGGLGPRERLAAVVRASMEV